ncbi:MAG: hypothetical protein U0163_09075 [Gemmatimonadaceae bacterium]
MPPAPRNTDDRAPARSIFKELIEINTTQSVGSTRKAAEAMAARVRAAGYPDGDIAIVGPDGERKNLIVRLHAAPGSPPHKALLPAAPHRRRGSQARRFPGPAIRSCSGKTAARSTGAAPTTTSPALPCSSLT